MRWYVPAIVGVVLTGCGSFTDQAREHGLTIEDTKAAHSAVTEICVNMDEGETSVVGVLGTATNERLSSNDQYLIRLGVADKCPEHNGRYADVERTLNAVWEAADQADLEQRSDPNYNVDPDGYCLGTPCGSHGKVPGGYHP